MSAPHGARVASPDPLEHVVLRRLTHAVLHHVALAVIFVPVFTAGLVTASTMVDDGMPIAVAVLPLVASLLVLAGVNWWGSVWIPRRCRGVTLTMRLLDLRIVTESGQEPSLRAYSIRWLMMAVDGAFVGLVGVATIVFTARHQRIGDMVAQTLVVRRAAVEAELNERADSARPR